MFEIDFSSQRKKKVMIRGENTGKINGIIVYFQRMVQSWLM